MATSLSTDSFYTNVAPSLTVDMEKMSEKKIDSDSLDSFFEISESINWIKENNLMRVALQFPDSLICYSSEITALLAEKTTAKFFVLADTSYRSCCVDEVAAAHANCDAIIHYGDACLSSPSGTLPVKYVLGRLPINVEVAAASISQNLSSGDVPLVVLADAPYCYAIDELVNYLQQKVTQEIYSSSVSSVPVSSDEVLTLGRKVTKKLDECDNALLIFIGSPDSPLLPIWLLTYPQCTEVIIYNTEDETVQQQPSYSTRQLRKRLFLVEKLRDANTVGLIVGSVGIQGHREAVKRMRDLCAATGKKIYVISVGKVNVPKLSNFTSDIDVFVLLSCPFGICLDNSEFIRPVLSLFEAEVALNPARSWMAGKGWMANFSEFIHGDIEKADEEMADMSLLTGRVRIKPQLEENAENNEAQIALYTAGDYFKQRTWKGLDDSVRTTEEDISVAEGRSGIACGYETESTTK